MITISERSIVVVSPYPTPYLVEHLLDRYQQGIGVTLVTTEEQARNPDIARRLVRQEWELNEKARRRRGLWMRRSLAAPGFALAVAILGAGFDIGYLLALGALPLTLVAFLCAYATRV
jgi:hypothetical protein